MPSSAFDIIVIGSGVAGLAAGKHAAQNGLATASIESALFGGLVINVNELDGMPGNEVTSGYRVATRLKMENMKLGVASLAETVTGIVADGEFLTIATNEGRHHARAVIVASGAQLKRLGIPGEAELVNRGVSQCTDCDGPMHKDKDAIIVGGGDSALQGALTLSKQCRRVYIVHRGVQFRARQHLVDAAKTRPNIEPVWNTVAKQVLGQKAVSGLKVRNIVSNESTKIPCSGLFAYIGLHPNNDFVPPEVRRDEGGYLITDDKGQTSMAGVYAAGAVRSGNGGLLTDAIADAQAAIESARLAMKAIA